MRREGDHYYRKAKQEDHVARAVYKLDELQRKYRLLKEGDRVLDLGAAPGSWSSFACEGVGERGQVVAVDQAEMSIPAHENLNVLQVDVMDLEASQLRNQFGEFDVVLSDLGPKTSGQRERDHLLSLELCQRASFLAEKLLCGRGKFVCKMYQGEESRTFLKQLEPHYQNVRIQKPKASRSTSREIYYVCIGFYRG